MSQDRHAGSLIDAVAVTPLGRRQMLGSVAAASLAGMVAGPAFAAPIGGADVRSFSARFGIHGGRTISGFFALPRTPGSMNVVVVMPGAEEVRARTEATARRYAAAGNLVIAPDLAATFRGRGLAGHDAMVAEFLALVPDLKRLPRGNGAVRVVSA